MAPWQNSPPEPLAAPLYEPPKGFETKFRDLSLHLAAFDGPLDLLLLPPSGTRSWTSWTRPWPT